MYHSLSSDLRCENVTCNGCNMGMGNLPDMYAQGPRVAGLTAEGIHIRQIMNGHVTTIIYHFVLIVATPVF